MGLWVPGLPGRPPSMPAIVIDGMLRPAAMAGDVVESCTPNSTRPMLTPAMAVAPSCRVCSRLAIAPSCRVCSRPRGPWSRDSMESANQPLMPSGLGSQQSRHHTPRLHVPSTSKCSWQGCTGRAKHSLSGRWAAAGKSCCHGLLQA